MPDTPATADSTDKLVEALRASMTEVARLRRRNQQLVDTAREPIAIVGMGCRLPGGVASPQDLWQLVAEGRDAISPVPTDRGWDLEALGTPLPQGGFLYDAADFDPGFFGISPREAVAMDPQQRLLLETTWEAVEHAGIDAGSLRGSRTGVFIGSAQPGYFVDPRDTDLQRYAVTASVASVISGRLSYVLGLQGPAATIDTACSSSLVAMHLASQALRLGECSLALAGGVAVMPNPATFVGFGSQQALAGDSRCKAFAAGADGMTLSEGVGVLVLERLSDARRNGHQVLALVRGSAVNQDGASNGLTAPNGPAQQRVIRDALGNAGLTPQEVDAVEAHGTGTSLGDPIEAQAIIAAYGQERPPGQPLWLGSLKSNIGHAQAAAGVASVIKSVLALRHGLLPASLHIDAPTPHVEWETGEVELLTAARPWPDNGHPRRIGVSSFGISGTNAHLIVEQAPQAPREPQTPDEPPAPPAAFTGAGPWLVSAKTPGALRGQAARLLGYVEGHPGIDPAAIGTALATTRATFEHRAAFPAPDRDTALTALRALAAGRSAADLIQGAAELRGKTAFVVAGGDAPSDVPSEDRSGDRRAAIEAARRASPVFAEQLTACAEALEPHTGGAPGAADPTDPGLPGSFTAAVATAAVWRACGVSPSTVLGDGSGEIAAAHLRGSLSLPEAARTVAARAGDGAAPADGPDTLADRIRAAVDSGHAFFVQIGHDPALSERIRTVLASIPAEAALIEPRGPEEPLAAQVARAHVLGVPVDWAGAHPAVPHGEVELPTYAFDHARYWLPMFAVEPPTDQAAAPAGTPAAPPVEAASPVPVVGDPGAPAPEEQAAPAAAPPQPVPADLPDSDFAAALSAASPDERLAALLDLVRTEVATLLDYPSAESVRPKHTFQDLGFDSLAALDMQGAMEEATGLTLPATLVFDHPTPARLAGHLYAELFGAQPVPAAPAPAPAAVPADATPQADDPVVIVGMSCRIPGGIDTPDALWQVLADGEDVVCPMPDDRGWDLAKLKAVEESMPAVRVLREAGFIHRAGDFDAEFFGISEDEALVLDPQQRLLLEMSWEALEHSGADPLALRGEQIGVFVGMFYQAYPADIQQVPPRSMRYIGGGASPAIAAGRVAYTFGLEGPTTALDAACSSSALALHLACQAVRAGDCTAALAGGVTVLAHPLAFPDMVGAAAPDGRCKSFGESADGTGYGEGAGMVMVERLSEARRRGHRVLAVIKGSAVNHNGESNGLTAPNGASQQRVIQRALAASGLRSDQIDAVEAHGAGTALGDPLEAQALLATYGRERDPRHPLWLGTVKSNIGHPHAASGIIGVIKMVLAMRHGTLPRTLHVDTPSTKVDWSAGAVSLLKESIPWPGTGRPRRAAVSSFGSSGTKVHLILEQAPDPVPAPDAQAVAASSTAPAPGGPVAWALSGRGADALQDQARRLLEHLARHAEFEPAAVGRALAARAHFDSRAVVLGTTREELLAGLDGLARGAAATRVAVPAGAGSDRTYGTLAALAEEFADGADVDWPAMFPAATAPVELPTYAFQRRRYWIPA